MSSLTELRHGREIEVRILKNEPEETEIRTVLSGGKKYHEHYRNGRLVKKVLVKDLRSWEDRSKRILREVEEIIAKNGKGEITK